MTRDRDLVAKTGGRHFILEKMGVRLQCFGMETEVFGFCSRDRILQACAG